MMGAQWGKPETQIGSESTPLLATAFQCGANATKEIKDVDKGTMFSGYFLFLKDLHWSCTDAVRISSLHYAIRVDIFGRGGLSRTKRVSKFLFL